MSDKKEIIEKEIKNNPTQTTEGSAWATHNNIFGDAMWETTYRGNEEGEAWNGDYSYYPYSVCAFVARGGKSTNAGLAGVFAFIHARGNLNNNLAFRACVVSPYLEIHFLAKKFVRIKVYRNPKLKSDIGNIILLLMSDLLYIRD